MSGRAVVVIAAATISVVVGAIWCGGRGADALSPQAAPVTSERGPVMVEPEPGRIDATPAPPPELTALAEVEVDRPTFGPRLPFDLVVDDLVCEAIQRNVAEQMHAVLKGNWGSWRYGGKDGTATRNASHRYFEAVLPGLRDRILDGRVAVTVRPTEYHRADMHVGGLGFVWQVDEEVLTASFHLPDWYVSLTLTRQSGEPELFDEIVASGKAWAGK